MLKKSKLKDIQQYEELLVYVRGLTPDIFPLRSSKTQFNKVEDKQPQRKKKKEKQEKKQTNF